MVKTAAITYIKQNVKDIRSQMQSIQMGYAKRDDSVFISIQTLNLLLKTSYANTQEMVYNPPPYEDELALRGLLCGADSLNPIIVIDSHIERSLKLFIDAYFQESSIFAIATY